MARQPIRAKIGTTSSTLIVVWKEKDVYKNGDSVIAMEWKLYNNLHSHYRRLKRCSEWKNFIVRETEPLLFLERI